MQSAVQGPPPLQSAPRRGFDGCSHGHGADLAPSVTRETIGSATVEADFFLVVVPGITIFLFRPRGSDPNHPIFSITSTTAGLLVFLAIVMLLVTVSGEVSNLRPFWTGRIHFSVIISDGD